MNGGVDEEGLEFAPRAVDDQHPEPGEHPVGVGDEDVGELLPPHGELGPAGIQEVRRVAPVTFRPQGQFGEPGLLPGKGGTHHEGTHPLRLRWTP